MSETSPENLTPRQTGHHRWPSDGGMDLILRRPRQGLIFKKKTRYTDLPLWLAEMMEGYQSYTLGLTLLGNRELPEPDPETVRKARERAVNLKRHHRFFAPSLDKLYRTKALYLGWLAREYDRYRAGLELLLMEGLQRPSRAQRPTDGQLTPDGRQPSEAQEASLSAWRSAEEAAREVSEELDLDQALEAELEELDRQSAAEFQLIDGIPQADWQRIAESESPGLALALFLGAEPELIEQDLSNAAALGLFSRLAGTRTDFATFEGPKAWYEEELGQIHKVVEGVARHIMGGVTGGLGHEIKRELTLENERVAEARKLPPDEDKVDPDSETGT